eukprot:7921482-Alexandrium_andersonii.AAC.1
MPAFVVDAPAEVGPSAMSTAGDSPAEAVPPAAGATDLPLLAEVGANMGGWKLSAPSGKGPCK